jgi:hypothetical protein
MGAWSYGIFDDDFTSDVRYGFEEHIKQGLSLEEATEQIFIDFEDDTQDEYYEQVLYLALAELGLKYRNISAEIKNKAIEIIESESSLQLWKEVGKNELEQRKIILNELKEKLIKYTVNL